MPADGEVDTADTRPRPDGSERDAREPATPTGLRASDADRERTTRALKHHHLEGRLTVDELGDRVSQALAAKSVNELDRLVGDLPSHGAAPTPRPAGVARGPDQMFCRTCGRLIYQTAVVCPYCGAASRGLSSELLQPKQKSTAVLLGVFLSFWTWLYTYKRDAWKFWVGLAICVTMFWFYFLPPLAVWIWAIVDTAVKDEAFYARFPNA